MSRLGLFEVRVRRDMYSRAGDFNNGLCVCWDWNVRGEWGRMGMKLKVLGLGTVLRLWALMVSW